jgi:hypothetical protein
MRNQEARVGAWRARARSLGQAESVLGQVEEGCKWERAMSPEVAEYGVCCCRE